MTEVHFRSPDDPYLIMAALRRRLGDEVLNAVVLIPSGDGPALEIRDDLLQDTEIAHWLTLLEASPVHA